MSPATPSHHNHCPRSDLFTARTYEGQGAKHNVLGETGMGRTTRQQWQWATCIYTVSRKVPTFKLSATLSNLNRFSHFCTAGKRMKFAIKPIRHYSSHLRHVAALSWEIKNSNFLQIFSRYGRKCKQVAFWVHRRIPVSRDISRSVLWIWGLSSWLNTKSLIVSAFSSVRILRSLPRCLAACPLCLGPAIFSTAYSITPRFVQLFSGNLSANLFAVYPFKYKLLKSKSCPRRW